MMHHAFRAASSGQLSRVACLPIMAKSTAASSYSYLRNPLPGVLGEPTGLWHNDKQADAPSAVEVINGEADLTNLLASASPNSLVVVKFHGVLCDASRAIDERFKQTAAEFADLDGQEITFADVCFDRNRQLCEQMGIRSLPHVQIFSGANGKVADFCIAPHQYNTLPSLLADRRESVHAGKGESECQA